MSVSAVEEETEDNEESVETDGDPLDGFTLASNAGKRHSVWRYFNLYSNGRDKKSECMCKLPNGKLCGKLANGWFSNNAVKHLQAHHSKESQEYDGIADQEKEKRQKLNVERQTSLDISIVRTQKYSALNPKQRDISKRLAVAFAANSLAYRLIENDDFRELLNCLNPQFSPPSRYLLTKQIGSLFENMRTNIRKAIDNATKISITADIWTKRGHSAAFLGVTCHWYDKPKNALESAVLAVRQIYGRHSAQLVSHTVKEILSEWEISPAKVFFVVTDNGSNMVAAFQEVVLIDRSSEIYGDSTDDVDEETGLLLAAEVDPALDESFVEPDDLAIERNQ